MRGRVDRQQSIFVAFDLEQRVPDDHVSVNANSARIRRLDLKDSKNFLASKNLFRTAEEMGLWDPKSGEPFEFFYAYGDRTSRWARRRISAPWSPMSSKRIR